MLQDIATLTGGTVISEDRYGAGKSNHRRHGSSERVVISKGTTTIIDGVGENCHRGRVAQIVEAGEEATTPTTIVKLRGA